MTTLFRVLESTAERDPGRVAIVQDDASITYGELVRLARNVAVHLSEMSVRPGDVVAVVAPKSIETIAAMYGVMAAGAAYTTIDPAAPAPQLRAVFADCSAAAIVHAGQDNVLGSAPPDAPLLEVGEIGDLPAGEARLPTVDADDLAYVVYTSGSTGSPKGVKRTHRNGTAVVDWAVRRFGFGPDDRFAGHTPLYFGPHRFDLYVSARVGASLYPLGPHETRLAGQMVAHVARHRLTVWWSAASALQAWIRQGGFVPDDLASLRYVMFGAERLPAGSWPRLPELLPQAELYAFYGSSETGTIACHRVGELGSPREGIYPLGYPCDIVDCVVLTEDGRAAAPGEEGELLVSGPGVMPGYLGSTPPEAFLESPLGREGRFFRTGDRVTLGADGALRLIGRLDEQIKIRGHRVYPAQIEEAIRSHPSVHDAAVIPVQQRGVMGIEAFVVTAGKLRAADIRRHVAERLPRYMVPSRVHLVPDLPRTSTGNLDSVSLRRESAAQSSGGSTMHASVENDR